MGGTAFAINSGQARPYVYTRVPARNSICRWRRRATESRCGDSEGHTTASKALSVSLHARTLNERTDAYRRQAAGKEERWKPAQEPSLLWPEIPPLPQIARVTLLTRRMINTLAALR